MGGAAGRGDGGAPVVVPESEWNATMAALFGVPPSGRKKKKPRDASAADEEDIPASSPASTRAKTGEERRPLVKT